MQRAFLLIVLFLFSIPVHATTYFIDASADGSNTEFPACVGGTCIQGFITQVYTFNTVGPGDTVDFGTVELFGNAVGGRGTTTSWAGT